MQSAGTNSVASPPTAMPGADPRPPCDVLSPTCPTGRLDREGDHEGDEDDRLRGGGRVGQSRGELAADRGFFYVLPAPQLSPAHSRPTGAFSTSFPRHADDTPTQAPKRRNSPTSTPVPSPSGRAQPSGWFLVPQPRESVPPHCPGPAATNVPRPTTQVFCEPGSWLTEIVSMGQTSLSGAPLRRG